MIRDTTGRPVVVGVDGSEGARAAVRWAARFAGERGMPLRLLYAATVADTMSVMLPVPAGVSSPGLSTRPRRPAGRVLAAAASEATRYGPPVEVSAHTASDTAVTALVDASSEAGLLVLGSSDRGRVATMLSGSVAARVVAAAHSPVVVVRGDPEPSGPVVVAVDGSDSGEPALRFAFVEAARRRCPLFAVHAWHASLVPVGAGAMAVAAAAIRIARADVEEAAGRLLTDTLAKWRTAFPDVPVHERLVDGYPEAAMPAETSGAALVVVGSRGRGPLIGLLLGSTSQALVRASSCPVAVVRDPDGHVRD